MESPQQPRPRAAIRSHHGHDFVDEYEWLREKDSPAVQEFLAAENKRTAQATAHLDKLRNSIYDEIRTRTRETDMSVPVRHRGWWYYARIVEGQNYSTSCRAPEHNENNWEPPNIDSISASDEQVLIDANADAAGLAFYQRGGATLSDDDEVLAWTVDTSGDERYDLNIRTLSTGETRWKVITGIGPNVVWSQNGHYLFYLRVDESWRPFQVWRHSLLTDEDDVLVFEEPDERYFVSVGRSGSEKFLVISLGSKITTEFRYLPASDPTGEFTVVWPRAEGVEYFLDHAIVNNTDHWVVLHNRNHANFELALMEVEKPNSPITLIEAADQVRLEDVDVTASHLFVSFRKDALPRVGYMELNSAGVGELQTIATEDELTAAGVSANSDWNSPYVRLGTSSFIEPPRIYDFDPITHDRILRKQGEVLGQFNPNDYTQERLWVSAQDGTKIPVSLVYRNDIQRDGSAPAVLYGYGAYESSIDPGFSIARLSLLNRGFVFAIAHVRGGGELGRAWYEDGKLLKKKNSFTDFVACARALVAHGYTSADRLIAEGGSAGGLLMGAVANLAPDAFCGILADVPFVDPLTSILDPSLPLTVIEWDEWGNPLEDQSVYEYMRSYSPYENVAEMHYPSILAVTSLNDTRVLYVEPAKWIARLQATGRGGPFLLKTEMEAGHGGVSGRYSAWRDRAWELAWIIDTTHAPFTENPRIS